YKLLRRNWSLGDRLLCNGLSFFDRVTLGISDYVAACIFLINLHSDALIKQLRSIVRPEILRNTVSDKDKGADNAERQANQKSRPRHVDPEVTNCFHLTAGDASYEGNGKSYSYSC